jgi:hypothetical protein
LTPAPNDEAGARRRQIGNETSFGVEHLCPDGNVDLDRLSICAMLLAASAVAAAAGAENLDPLVRGQIAERGVRDYDDAAATASVAAVGAALRHELLAPEAEAAVTAPPGFDMDLGSVVKHGSGSEPSS